MTEQVPVLVITGPVGVGKSAVAAAVSELLGRAGVPHAMVDLDHLRWCFPRPGDDPFHVRLGLRNLAAVWANCHAAGALRLVLADIVESREALADYREAVPAATIQVVRLHASPRRSRIAWHAARSVRASSGTGGARSSWRR